MAPVLSRVKSKKDKGFRPRKNHEVAVATQRIIRNLPPEHPDRRHRGGGAMDKKMEKDMERKVRRLATQAKLNHIVSPDFSFVRAAARRRQPQPTEMETWHDDIPRSIESSDGFDLVHYLPGVISERGKAKLTKVLLDYGEQVHADHNKAQGQKSNAFHDEPGELHGLSTSSAADTSSRGRVGSSKSWHRYLALSMRPSGRSTRTFTSC
ncbi:hypothetical protein B0H21DRAFT_707356 [Amylocystis lapponica]|nr:hypothetical protein B0H21DRAFT_707356 [Amylocystis lapponica]